MTVQYKKMIFIISSIFAATLFAQAPDTLWTKTYGGADYDYGESVQQTFDGGYIVVGYTYSFGSGYDDVYLIKTNADGDTQWSKTYGAADYDAGSSVEQCPDSGYVIAGLADWSGPGTGAFYLIRTNTMGDTLWTKKFRGDYEEVSNSVTQTADEGYIIVGLTFSFGPGTPDYSNIYLIKTDSIGDTIWTKTFGGMDWEDGYSVQQTSDGGYAIVGFTTSYGSGGMDVYFIKTDSIGDTLWAKTYGGGQDDWGNEVQQTSDGGYIVVGGTQSFGEDYQVYLIKTDSLGDTLWTKTYGGMYGDTGQSIQQLTDAGYIIVGTTMSFGAGSMDIYLIKTDSIGNTLWTRTYGGIDIDGGYEIQKTSDGGYIIVGSTQSFGAGFSDFYLIKIAPDTIGVEENQFINHQIPFLEVNPNPFTNKVTIRYHIKYSVSGEARDVRLKIYNIAGQLIKHFSPPTDCSLTFTSLVWDGKDDNGRFLPGGVYFVQLDTSTNSIIAKIVKLK